MLMASLRDPYGVQAMQGVQSILGARRLAQLNQLMMQQRGPAMGQAMGQAMGAMGQDMGQPPPPPHSPPQAAPSLAGALPGAPPECQSPPISRTYTYKKVTKPFLERKRRARINGCLDELKELMVGALEAEGENVSKLEKADILEMTVRFLKRITKPRDVAEDASRFQAGFSQCASEACHFLLGLPGLDAGVGRRLVAHLSQVVTELGPSLAANLAANHAANIGSVRPTAYSPPASPDLLLARQHQAQDPSLIASTSSSRSSPRSPSGPASPEVSSTSSAGWAGAGPAARPVKRPLERSEAEDSDDDLDSDSPVNYATDALSKQQAKRPRFDYSDPTGRAVQPAEQSNEQPYGQTHCSSTSGAMGYDMSCAMSSARSYVSSSAASQSGSDDEDKGPMWRPW